MADPSLTQFLTNPSSTPIPPNPVLQATANGAAALQAGQPQAATPAAQNASNVPAPPSNGQMIPGTQNGQVSPQMQAQLMAAMTPGNSQALQAPPQTPQDPANPVQPGVSAGTPPTSPSPTAPAGQTHLSQVRGPFGSKGVLGDILGHVMDTVLVNAGLKPEYTVRVQQAKYADALGDFQHDPQGAVNRLSQAGYIDQAQTLQNNLVHQQYESVEEQADRQKMITDALLAPSNLAKASSSAAQPFFGLAANATPNSAAAIGARIKKRLGGDPSDPSSKGLDPDALTDFPEQSDYPKPEDYAKALQKWSLSGMSVGTKYTADQRGSYQQQEIGAREQGLGIQQQSANQSGENMSSEIADRAQNASLRALAEKDRQTDRQTSLAEQKRVNDARVAESGARTKYIQSKTPKPGIRGPDANGNYWELKTDGSIVPAHNPNPEPGLLDRIKSVF